MTEQKYDIDDLNDKARRHLWMHFTRHSPYKDNDIPIIVKAEGHHIWDIHGKKYFDGLSSLFTVNAGHGRHRYAEAAATQMKQLDFFPIWSYAHPKAIELAERVLSYAPAGLNRVFFTTGGGEAVDLARTRSQIAHGEGLHLAVGQRHRAHRGAGRRRADAARVRADPRARGHGRAGRDTLVVPTDRSRHDWIARGCLGDHRAFWLQNF